MLWACQPLRPDSPDWRWRRAGVLALSPWDTARRAGLYVWFRPYLTSEASVMFFRAQVRRALQRVPGKQRFGIYRFLPFFFVLGGAMEWIMIKVRVGQETFCKWGCGSLHSPVGMRLQAADSTQGRAAFTLGKDKCSFSGSSRAARTRGPRGSCVSLPLASSPLSPPALLEGTGLH